MNVKLVLASAPVTLKERYGDFAGAASTEPSFGLVCLAAAAREAGAGVAIVEAASRDLAVEETCREILELQPDAVGLSATTVGIVAAAELARALKQVRPELSVFAGGCHATSLPVQTMEEFDGFDMVIRGEGEETLVDILAHLDRHGTLPEGAAGTVVRTPSGIHRNPDRPYIDDLDRLPLPAWDLLPDFPKAYRPSPARIRRWPCASVVLTRGCPNRCTFCDRSVFGNMCRGYSPAYAVRLLKDLRYNYGAKEILIEDDTFVIRKRNVQEFCERLIADKVDVAWSCLGRANLVDPELLGLMHRAGCWHISYGIESGDAGILERANKKLDLEQITRAVTWSRQAGLRTKGFFMVGFPGETHATLEATRRLVATLPLDDISVMQLTPFPGSDLYEEAGKSGAFDSDWRKMNTLNTVFVPDGLTAADLDAARAGILRTFYSRPSVLFGAFLHTLSHPRLILHMLRGVAALVRVMLAGRSGS